MKSHRITWGKSSSKQDILTKSDLLQITLGHQFEYLKTLRLITLAIAQSRDLTSIRRWFTTVSGAHTEIVCPFVIRRRVYECMLDILAQLPQDLQVRGTIKASPTSVERKSIP